MFLERDLRYVHHVDLHVQTFNETFSEAIADAINKLIDELRKRHLENENVKLTIVVNIQKGAEYD